MKREIDEAVEQARAAPFPPDEELWSNVYKGERRRRQPGGGWQKEACMRSRASAGGGSGGGSGADGHCCGPPDAAPLGMTLRGLHSEHKLNLPK